MSAVKALIAAGALAAAAAPATALAHGGVSVGFVFGSPGWYGPAYYPYYGPAYYGPAYYDYDEPYYAPAYYGSYGWPHYRHHRYHPRRYYYRTSYVSRPCHWITNRYYERNGDYVVRHERICR